ncbi:hypothetical protein BESB_034250 [Besnoitia besnoiti]|uniref:Uncharacterized protein n=1 Tax=Besnoitia besnoiti TaxID=94643 RepID=A0A2A9MMH2_BESBE|nr:hypothetical protein BESB_034250 [Besnoitia besnoiti]PFH36967.1 hypothetical protein BESB_034250 [Besnoitia besnoiti]
MSKQELKMFASFAERAALVRASDAICSNGRRTRTVPSIIARATPLASAKGEGEHEVASIPRVSSFPPGSVSSLSSAPAGSPPKRRLPRGGLQRPRVAPPAHEANPKAYADGEQPRSRAERGAPSAPPGSRYSRLTPESPSPSRARAATPTRRLSLSPASPPAPASAPTPRLAARPPQPSELRASSRSPRQTPSSAASSAWPPHASARLPVPSRARAASVDPREPEQGAGGARVKESPTTKRPVQSSAEASGEKAKPPGREKEASEEGQTGSEGGRGGDGGAEAGCPEGDSGRPSMAECVQLLQWLVAENIEVDASVLTVDAEAATLRLLLPHAAVPFLPTQVQLRREDYHPLRSFAREEAAEAAALEPRKKSPFAYVRHPLRLASAPSTSVGPSLPFTWLYTTDKERLSPEQLQTQRWELLRPGHHLRVRIDRVTTPDGCVFVATPDESPASAGDTRMENPEARRCDALQQQGEETEAELEVEPANQVKKGPAGGRGKKKKISLRVAFGWPPQNVKEELERWRRIKAEAERRLGSKDRENVTGEKLKKGLEKLISQDISWALPHLSPLEVTFYLPAHMTSPGIHPHPSEVAPPNRNRNSLSPWQEKKKLIEEIRETEREANASEASASSEDTLSAEGEAIKADGAEAPDTQSGVRTTEEVGERTAAGVQTPAKEWIPPLRPPSRQPHRSRIIGVLNNFLLVEVDVEQRRRKETSEEGQDEISSSGTAVRNSDEAPDTKLGDKQTIVALLPIEEFGHIVDWIRHREKVYIHRNTYTYGLSMKGIKPWEGFRFAEDQKTGRDDAVESKAPPSSLDLYFSCVQRFPLDLDFPAVASLSAFLPPVRGPPRSPPAGAVAKLGAQAVLETANYLFNSAASSVSASASSGAASASFPVLPLPRSPAKPPWVVIMSAHSPIPTELAYMLFFHQPPNHLQPEIDRFHKLLEEREQEHLADTLAQYRAYGEPGRPALEKWRRLHRQSLRQRQGMRFPWWEARGDDAREAELQNLLGYFQYHKLLLAREAAKEEAALGQIHNAIISDRHGEDFQDITEWVLDEEKKKRLTPKLVRQFVEDVEDGCALLRRIDLTEPLKSLMDERDRLLSADISGNPRLEARKRLLVGRRSSVPRGAIEAAEGLHPAARLLLLRFHDSGIPVQDPIAWMLKLHREKRRWSPGEPFSPPLWEMFMLHARVNLQKAAPPDDVPSYEEWQKAESAGRRKFTRKRDGDGQGRLIVDPIEAMIEQMPEGASDFLHDSTDAAVSSQALRNLQRDMASALLPRGSRREGMLDEYVNIKDLHPDIPELTELAGGKAANQRCEVFLPLTDAAAEPQ